MLFAAGVTVWILAQALINIGGVVGVMPLTGLTLPFVSFGGSSLLVSMAAAGLLLNVARHPHRRVPPRRLVAAAVALVTADSGDMTAEATTLFP